MRDSWPLLAAVDPAPAMPSAATLNSATRARRTNSWSDRSVRTLPGRAADSADLDVDVERLGEFESRLTLGGRRFQVVSVAGTTEFLVEVDGISHQISQDEAGLVRAHSSPAVVVALPFAVGDEVEAGDTLVVLESMKMETAIRAPPRDASARCSR